jgi:hypothetical protein
LRGALPEGDWALKFAAPCEHELKTAKVRMRKELFVKFLQQPDATRGLAFFKYRRNSVMRSRTDPFNPDSAIEDQTVRSS